MIIKRNGYMMNKNNKKIAGKDKSPFMQRGITVFLGTMISCALWGSAFPGVKTGMRLLSIGPDDTANQLLFAGIRFFMAGIMIIAVDCIIRRKLLIPDKRQAVKILILSLFQTVGQYTFYYIGIAHTSGVNTSIVDSTSYFFAILSSTLLFRMEKMTWKKIFGCLLGFSGVILVNMSGLSLHFNMTFSGEGMILLSSMSYAFSSSFTKIFSKDDDPVLLSGYQFITGSLILIAASKTAGARIQNVSVPAAVLWVYLAFISAAAFSIWSVLLKYNDVSRVSIYGFMNPIFGVLMSAAFLGETEGLGLNYIAALIIISVGITLVNRTGSK